MKGILIWGAGLQGQADAADPEQMQKTSPAWASDIKALAPWHSISLPFEGRACRCWISAEDSMHSPLIITGPCASTMDSAWRFVQNALLPVWGAVLAVSQWSGRGQLGREWHSPADNLYGACRLPRPFQMWDELLPLIVGYALIRSFSQIGVAAALKWPNDLIIQDKKVGGILIEVKGDAIIAGVGLNLVSSPPAGMLRNTGAVPAASFSDFGYNFTPIALWCDLMKMVRTFFEEVIETSNPSRFIEDVHSHLAFAGQTVRVDDHNRPMYVARIIGLTRNGGLQLFTGKEITILRSGSIYPMTMSHIEEI